MRDTTDVVFSDDDEYQEYLFSYSFGDKEWCFSVIARSEQEASERLTAMQAATYDGSGRYSALR